MNRGFEKLFVILLLAIIVDGALEFISRVLTDHWLIGAFGVLLGVGASVAMVWHIKLRRRILAG